jgi:hypothetical protein
LRHYPPSNGPIAGPHIPSGRRAKRAILRLDGPIAVFEEVHVAVRAQVLMTFTGGAAAEALGFEARRKLTREI